jgi:hypothetical protein
VKQSEIYRHSDPDYIWREKYESGELDKVFHKLRMLLPMIDPSVLMVSFPEGFACNSVYRPKSDENPTFSTFMERQYAELYN